METVIKTLAPDEPLRAWITGFVLRDEPGRGQVVRILPEPRATVQIVLGDPYWLRGREDGAQWSVAPRVGLWGPRYAFAFGWPQAHVRILGLGLTPGGLRALTGQRAGAVVDRVLPLADVRADIAEALNNLPADDLGGMAAAVSSVLAAAFKKAAAADPVTPEAVECLATLGGGAVAQAAALCGLSDRHFRRVFEEFYGVPPKLYQRVRRIDRMIRALHPRPWETDALRDHETGFADQPHGIREFQALTGLTPEAYARAVARTGGSVLRSVVEAGVPPPVLNDR